MSSGPPVRIPKPRSRSASWKLDRPRSNRSPSTAPKPAAGATVGELPEVRLAQDQAIAEAITEARADTGDRAGSASRPSNRPSGVGFQDPLGVPTAAEGRVDLEAAGRRARASS